MTDKEKKENEKEKDLEILYQRRENLNKIRLTSADYFDKYLLTFSTGSLYLSVLSTNSKKIAEHKDILAIGWFFLLMTIIITMISFVISEKAYEKQMNIVGRRISNLIKGKNSKNNEINIYNNFLNAIKLLGAFSFIIGIILLVIFYFLNI